MKLIILDRDGVINQESKEFIKCPEEWHAIPGSLEAIARLNQNGYRVVVVSNQSGIARGKLDLEQLDAIHSKMRDELSKHGGEIEAIFFCPHGPDDNCECRKPKPGLFNQISRHLNVSLEGIPLVGDKLSDLEAARAIGASPLLVKTGYGQTLVDGDGVPEDIPVYEDLASVVDALLAAG